MHILLCTQAFFIIFKFYFLPFRNVAKLNDIVILHITEKYSLRGYSFFSEGNQAEKMAYKYKPIKDEILGSDSEG